MSRTERFFSNQYRENVILDDGSEVGLRLVQPEDKRLFVEGFARLGPQSRYRRFFSPKKRLSERELSYLTELDGEMHFALAAVRRNAAGAEEGLGVARFVRFAGEPEVAEPAVAVIDDMQGRGLGRILLARLTAAARERGVEQFRCSVLADNAPMMALLADDETVHVRPGDDGVVEVEMILPHVRLTRPTGVRQTALYRLLTMAAAKVARLLRASSWLEPEAGPSDGPPET